MSRTDKTKPLRVRYAEHNPLPVHDHRFGPCDLPPTPSWDDDDTRCRWRYPYSMLFGGTCCSGCYKPACVKERQQWDKEANRRERYAARREARRYVTGEIDD